MEKRTVKCVKKYMTGFDVTVTENEIQIAKGELFVKGVTYPFEAVSIAIDRTEHALYDLYIVGDNDFTYHLEKTYLDGSYIPAYSGDLKLFHNFIVLEVDPNDTDRGTVFHIEKIDPVKEVSADKPPNDDRA